MHAAHHALPGYHPETILHDDCPECDERASDVLHALDRLDHQNRLRAWQLMRAVKWSGGRGVNRPVSGNDIRLANGLYSIGVFLEKIGIGPAEVEARMLEENERLEAEHARIFGSDA